nr:cytochrome P450 [Spodoptera frugiperda]
MLILLIWVAVLVAAVVLYFRQLYSSFSRRGVKHVKPVPIFGNMGGIILRIDHICDSVMKLYNDFPEERFVGRYEFVNELIMVRDIDLIKKIAVKDFEHFLDHRFIFSSSESYFSRNLFSLRGQEWKDMRSTLSPAFTSSKMRLMVPFMVEVGEQMMQSLHQSIKQSKDGSIDIECKDLTTRYANDVIASCAFGLKVDSHNDKNNSFYALGKETSTFNFPQIIKSFMLANVPEIAKLLKLDFLSESSKKAFKSLVLDTMENRELKNIIRPDMIHLLMEAKKGKLTHDDIKSNDVATGFATVTESAVGKKSVKRDWSDSDLIAQAVVFFVAGFETVSTAMSFLLYELALHPDIQERLAQEIKENDAKNGGKFDFNSIQNMVYMDMVVSGEVDVAEE